MAKLIKSYKGYKIKETTKNDNSTFKYWVILPVWSTTEAVWECDSIQEAEDFINSDKGVI